MPREELLFDRIDQHLRSAAIFGAPANAVKVQVRIATAVHVLVALPKKRSGVEPIVYTPLRVRSFTGSGPITISRAPANTNHARPDGASGNRSPPFHSVPDRVRLR